MTSNREVFLEKQINLYAVLIDELENSRMNRKQRNDLSNFQTLYRQYVGEYKNILLKKERA